MCNYQNNTQCQESNQNFENSSQTIKTIRNVKSQIKILKMQVETIQIILNFKGVFCNLPLYI